MGWHERRRARTRLAVAAFVAALACLVLAIVLVDGWSTSQRLLAIGGLLLVAAAVAAVAASEA